MADRSQKLGNEMKHLQYYDENRSTAARVDGDQLVAFYANETKKMVSKQSSSL